MSPNIILIDAEHLDVMTFEMIVNFERMLGRRIPTADLPNWLDYIVLDSGFRPGENTFQAVFIHQINIAVFCFAHFIRKSPLHCNTSPPLALPKTSTKRLSRTTLENFNSPPSPSNLS